MSYKNLDRKNPNGTDNYTDYSDNLFSAYQKIEKKLEDLSKNNLSNIRKINALNNKIDKLENIIAEKDKIIEEQGLTILKLKSQLNKDSSNSSKPSSTNGYKKVITNRRVKSDKPIGGQKGHAPHSLNKTKLQKFIDSGDIVYKTIDVNKNAKNKNKRFISKNVIDFQILKTLTEYRYYPDEHGKYITKKFNMVVISKLFVLLFLMIYTILPMVLLDLSILFPMVVLLCQKVL